jgi:hypothetical protein
MSKGEGRSRATGTPQEPLTHPASAGSSRWMGLAVVGGLGVLVGFAYLNLIEMRGIHRVLDTRLDQIDTRLVQLSRKVEQAGTRPAAVERSGPDPNRVYAIRTDGAPFKGPAAAPITIAEFSDFE